MNLFGITVLTSLSGKEWSDVHPKTEIQEALISRAETAERAGLDGLVCSPLDLHLLQDKAKGLMRVVPGIRAAKVSTEDQARIATAAEAATAGANYIVVGRPILEANDPINATKNIIEILSKVKR